MIHWISLETDLPWGIVMGVGKLNVEFSEWSLLDCNAAESIIQQHSTTK